MLSQTILLIVIGLPLVYSQTTYVCDQNAPCGCSSAPAVVSRIYGGEAALNNTWGWAAGILLNNTYVCGGTLISSSWILTSVGCVGYYPPWDIAVSVATNVLLGWKQWRYANAVYRNPAYQSSTFSNDLALIQVTSPFNMSDPGIASICLPEATTADYPPINSTLVGIGWGTTANGGYLSSTLMQATFIRLAYNGTTCAAATLNRTTAFCASGTNYSKAMCPGDFGGPLMMFTASQQWVLVGVASSGFGCSNTGYPTVFMRVSSFLSWIQSMNVTGTTTVSDGTRMTTSVPATSTSTSTIINLTTVRSTTIRRVTTTTTASLSSTTPSIGQSTTTGNSAYLTVQPATGIRLACAIIMIFTYMIL